MMALTLCCGAGAAQSGCRQALALGLDVSGSVDAREYRMQIDGLAVALSHPEVQHALLALPRDPVRLAIYEWSGAGYQRLLVDWTELPDAEAIAALAAKLRGTGRRPAPPETALGAAMRYGAALLDQQPRCWRRTLDISGDGRHNQGPHPRAIKAGLADRDMVLNALVIGDDAPRGPAARAAQLGALASYFRAWVISGPGAFAETAPGFDAYEDAMIRKLRRELELPALSQLHRPPGQ